MEAIITNLTDLINGLLTDGFVIVLACFVLGQIIKTSNINFFKKIDNRNIPIITALFGMILSFVPDIFPQDSLITALIKGAVSGWAATGMYEFYRNYKKMKIKEEHLLEKEIEEEMNDDEKGLQ